MERYTHGNLKDAISMSNVAEDKVWNLYASKDEDGVFNDIFPTKRQVKSCADNAHPVSVTLAKPGQAGTHWGWLESAGEICMMFTSKYMLDLCFAYGLEAETKEGKGSAVEVIITERPED
jgi:hypothetical protein